MVRSDSATLKSCNCLPECNSIEYNYNIIRDAFEDLNVSENLSATAASIYFGDDYFIAYKRFESYGTVRLLSNIGGYLGLFLGASVLSLVEVIYFFTLRFVDDFWYTQSTE